MVPKVHSPSWIFYWFVKSYIFINWKYTKYLGTQSHTCTHLCLQVAFLNNWSICMFWFSIVMIVFGDIVIFLSERFFFSKWYWFTILWLLVIMLIFSSFLFRCWYWAGFIYTAHGSCPRGTCWTCEILASARFVAWILFYIFLFLKLVDMFWLHCQIDWL